MAETKSLGSIGSSVFDALFEAAGGLVPVLLALVFMTAGEIFNDLCSWYISYWTKLSSFDQHAWASTWYKLIIVCVLICFSERSFSG